MNKCTKYIYHSALHTVNSVHLLSLDRYVPYIILLYLLLLFLLFYQNVEVYVSFILLFKNFLLQEIVNIQEWREYFEASQYTFHPASEIINTFTDLFHISTPFLMEQFKAYPRHHLILCVKLFSLKTEMFLTNITYILLLCLIS